MEKVFLLRLTAIGMKGSGRMVWSMGGGRGCSLQVRRMRVISSTVRFMELEGESSRMGASTSDNLRRELSTALVSLPSLTAIAMKASGLKESPMVEVHAPGPTAPNTSATLTMIRWTARVFINSETVITTKVIGVRECSMGRESRRGWTGDSTQASLGIVSSTGMGSRLRRMDIVMRASG